MKDETLRGWYVDVKTRTIAKVENGRTYQEEMTSLIFQERIPNSGNTITWEIDRATKDELVRKLTGGIVLHSGDLPNV